MITLRYVIKGLRFRRTYRDSREAAVRIDILRRQGIAVTVTVTA
jgi:hypothetical protein